MNALSIEDDDMVTTIVITVVEFYDVVVEIQ